MIISPNRHEPISMEDGVPTLRFIEAIEDIVDEVNTLPETNDNVAVNAAAIAAITAAVEAYTVTNVTVDRDYDADSTTTAELADVLGTLIADLQEAGIVP